MFSEAMMKLVHSKLSKMDDPNFWGEVFRDVIFYQSDGTGCYSTFDLNSGWVEAPCTDDELGGVIREMSPWEDFIAYSTQITHPEIPLKCAYYWDGDGTLIFIIDNSKVLINTDCKKDYTWEWLHDNFKSNQM